MKAFIWFLGLVGASFAGFAALSGGPPDLALSAVPPAASEASTLTQLAPEGIARLQWPSFLYGVVAGVVLTILARVSWFDLPRRFVAWLWHNERNFYRLGMAGVCLGVLLFY